MYVYFCSDVVEGISLGGTYLRLRVALSAIHIIYLDDMMSLMGRDWTGLWADRKKKKKKGREEGRVGR